MDESLVLAYDDVPTYRATSTPNITAEYVAATRPEANLADSFNRSLVFVHIGKAGGETIKGVLAAGCLSRRNKRARRNCLEQLPVSRLSDAVKGYVHCFDRISPKVASETTSFLYSLRHPVDRALSWYRYIHPSNCDRERGISPRCQAQRALAEEGWVADFFVQCFSSAEDWALAAFQEETTTKCKTLALQAFEGKMDYQQTPLAAHMIANFQHYVRNTLTQFPEREVMVIRTDHMWEDLKALDIQLGGSGGNFSAVDGKRVTHGSENFAEQGYVSERGTKLMCCALMEEMSVYLDLIERAVNLNQSQKLEELQAACRLCGADSWTSLVSICDRLRTRIENESLVREIE